MTPYDYGRLMEILVVLATHGHPIVDDDTINPHAVRLDYGPVGEILLTMPDHAHGDSTNIHTTATEIVTVLKGHGVQVQLRVLTTTDRTGRVLPLDRALATGAALWVQ